MNNMNEDLTNRIENIILRIEEEAEIDNLYQKMKGLGIKLGISERLLKSVMINKAIYEKDYLIVLLRWAGQNLEYSKIDNYIDRIEKIKNLRYVASVAFDNRNIFGSRGEDFFRAIACYDTNRLLELDEEPLTQNGGDIKLISK